MASRHPFIRYPPYEAEVEDARHRFVFFRESIDRGADRSPGKPARERTEQLHGLVTELRDHGYREATVGPFVVFAPPT